MLKRVTIKLLIIGSTFWVLVFQVKICLAKSEAAFPKPYTHRLQIGNETADLTIRFKSSTNTDSDSNLNYNRRSKKTTTTTKKPKRRNKNSKVGNGKDDFEDETGFYADDTSLFGKLTSDHSHHSTYDYTGGHSDHDYHDHAHEERHDLPTTNLVAGSGETSFSLISFITFANFLLFVLYPLLTLPKRARLANDFHNSLHHKETYHHYHPSPTIVETDPGVSTLSGVGQTYGSEDAGYHYEPAMPPSSWPGGNDDTIGYQPGPAPSWGSGATEYDYSQGDSGSGFTHGEWNMPSPSKPMMPKPKSSKSKKKKRNKMKGQHSEVGPVYAYDQQPESAEVQTTAGKPDDSVLSKDEILQILQSL